MPPGIAVARAGPRVGEDRHRHAAGGDRAAVDVRQAVFHREVVEQEPRLEIVETVEDDVAALGETLGVAVIEVIDVGVDHDIGVDPRDLGAGGLGLGHFPLDVLLVEEHLSLEVGQLDRVAIPTLFTS